jgi:hypothetical protein
MIVIGENNKEYEGRWEDGRIIVDTSSRKAFIMRNEYMIKNEVIKMICKTTHQKKDVCAFGGFGFEVI